MLFRFLLPKPDGKFKHSSELRSEKCLEILHGDPEETFPNCKVYNFSSSTHSISDVKREKVSSERLRSGW